MSDDFVRDLEEELVAAAQFRAQRRRRRLPRPHVSPRLLIGALAGVAALVLVATLAALALNRGGDDRAADRHAAPPPPGGLVVPAVPMLPAA